MNYVAPIRTSIRANFSKTQAWTANRQALAAKQPKELDIVTRRYEISWLTGDGHADARTCVAPALPIFEDAFSAFAQGALIQTDQGYVAIEDLQPGDRIATADGDLQPLLWIGSMTLFPQNLGLDVPSARLFRLTEGGYGHDRSTPDLLLGPAARILPGVLATNSSSSLLALDGLVDGHSVIAISPVVPMRVFHLGLSSHALLRANGILVESYHPGEQPHRHMQPDFFGHFLGLFPHMKTIDDFGPLNHKR